MVRRVRLALSFLTLALLSLAGTCSLAGPAAETSSQRVAFSTLGFELFLGLLACAGAALLAESASRRLGLVPSRVTPRQTLILVIGTLALSAAIDSALDLSGLRENSALAEIDAHLLGVRGGGLLLALAAFAVGPGVAEELLCRGLVQRGLERALGGPLAIALAAAFFGALHVDPVHAVSAGVLGLYLGAICWLAGSVRTAIASHLINNAVAVLAAAYGVGSPPAAAIVVGGALCVLCLVRVWRQLGGPPAADRPRVPIGAKDPHLVDERDRNPAA